MFSRIIALSAALCLGLPAAALAAPNCAAIQARLGCGCAVPVVPGQPVGQLTGVHGDVKKTGEGAFTPVSADVPVQIGDGILTGKDGQALLTFGPACQQMKLASFTSVVVREVEGCACITSVDSGGAPVPPVGGGVAAGGAGAAAPAVVAVGAGVAGFIALGADDSQDSP
jgi:hypothetical protein